MIDGIIKNDGTSRLMRSTLPATYEEFKKACEAGTQPIDVLFNEAGWAQLPDFLNKGNLWADDTASLFGLDANSVPNDGFKKMYNKIENTNSKITKELLLKINDTPESSESASFAVDLSSFDIAKYKSAIIYADIYMNHNGGAVKVTSNGVSFYTTGSQDSKEYLGFTFAPYSGTTSYLAKVGSIEMHFQFSQAVKQQEGEVFGYAITSGATFIGSVGEFVGFSGGKESGNALGVYAFTNTCEGGKAAMKHIEVFGERYV